MSQTTATRPRAGSTPHAPADHADRTGRPDRGAVPTAGPAARPAADHAAHATARTRPATLAAAVADIADRPGATWFAASAVCAALVVATALLSPVSGPCVFAVMAVLFLGVGLRLDHRAGRTGRAAHTAHTAHAGRAAHPGHPGAHPGAHPAPTPRRAPRTGATAAGEDA
ncbi:hypothetical protein [Corynebacterium bovis]|uniref:Uncharacterized protein n=1 Tax=Corynebacterium bovis DSM 20582 = CIP 54.80 TaxID=927655 RepID=A0A8H9YBK4_9CORY|nr:hypothetical protein [Corynebacterium bovis]MBB3116051.1 hypothetical protein [Corynebacterium bovis DSM 20582 = CIP 54.80]QQC46989.1 hypothetical protein I6I09_07855 [Corynebacterium bovis]RRQ13934.1 hypothetical protein CXF47_03625 [Corynebacterium bovis]RRQ15130.1 hypothetical protein CXF46_09360 [Corynebacterium bovis]WJY76637.1 hypothetical protein CBOVI_00425 [Corynebacterium bovis DSM 20582 = CIP 54.80]